MTNIAAIILAAGESSRLGFPKQLVSFNGELLIQNISRKICALELSKNICITGAKSVEVNTAIQDYHLEVIHNDYYHNGMSESIMKGIRNLLLDDQTDAALIVLCDQPLIPLSHYQALISAYTENNNKIVCSSYLDTLGVPAVFDRSCFRSLLTLDKGGGAKRIINEYIDDTISIPCSEAGFDIDTPEALASLKLLESKSNYSSI